MSAAARHSRSTSLQETRTTHPAWRVGCRRTPWFGNRAIAFTRYAHSVPSLPEVLSRLVPGVGQPTLGFALLLVVHIGAGVACVISGAVAALSPKQPGRHPRAGTIYFWALCVVFVTTILMSALRWSRDYHLLILGTLSFAMASLGYTARKVRWIGWTTPHIVGMSLSYIVLLTAFYVDNGPNLPLWSRLPRIAFWIGPLLIGLPFVVRALDRHAHVIDDIRGSWHALRRAGAAARRE
jgi:hypothetical protein